MRSGEERNDEWLQLPRLVFLVANTVLASHEHLLFYGWIRSSPPQMVQFQGATEITLKSERIPFWDFNSANNIFIGSLNPKYSKMKSESLDASKTTAAAAAATSRGAPKIYAVDESRETDNELTPLTPTSAARRKKPFG